MTMNCIGLFNHEYYTVFVRRCFLVDHIAMAPLQPIMVINQVNIIKFTTQNCT